MGHMPANLIRLTRLFLYRNPVICICRFIKQVVVVDTLKVMIIGYIKNKTLQGPDTAPE